MSIQMGPAAIVDGRMRKCTGVWELIPHAYLIGLGPGFDAGKNCQVVIETNRGSRLGRVITDGST